MPIVVSASTQPFDVEWEPREKDVKAYLHFDRRLSAREIKRIGNDADFVSKNSFFPLLRFDESWTKFRKNGVLVQKKRPIRYASRRDSAIYASYRSMLSRFYESELSKRGLGDFPVAYRKIPKDGGGNKSNIEISKEIFNYVRKLGDCIVTVVDIKSYFESLDHSRLRDTWAAMIGCDLPPDHEAVFKSITQYSFVSVDQLLKRLDMLSLDGGANRKERRQRKIDKLRDRHHLQLCSPSQFRDLVSGRRSAFPSIIQKNGFDFGIPQGTPISDLLANMYLIDFDEEIGKYVQSLGGIYRRYSDDIVVVLPKENSEYEMLAKEMLQSTIRKYGSHLKIQNKKVAVVEFTKSSSGLLFTHRYGKSSKNGLEYLGFQFDGVQVRIKDATLSNAWRKLKKRSYGYAWRFVKRYRARGIEWLSVNYPSSLLEKQLLQCVTYSQDTGFEKWTFLKYVERANRAFQDYNCAFTNQTRRYRKLTRRVIKLSFERAVQKHS